MKTNMKREPTDLEKCKLERLKMTAAYGWVGEALAWASGIEAHQKSIRCGLVQGPERPGSRRRPRPHS